MGFEPRHPGVRALCAQALCYIPLTIFGVGLRAGTLIAQSPLPPTVGHKASHVTRRLQGEGVEIAVLICLRTLKEGTYPQFSTLWRGMDGRGRESCKAPTEREAGWTRQGQETELGES